MSKVFSIIEYRDVDPSLFNNVVIITLVSQLLLFCSICGCFCSSFVTVTAIDVSGVAFIVVMHCAPTISQKVFCAFHQIAHSLELKQCLSYRVQDNIINLCCLLV